MAYIAIYIWIWFHILTPCTALMSSTNSPGYDSTIQQRLYLLRSVQIAVEHAPDKSWSLCRRSGEHSVLLIIFENTYWTFTSEWNCLPSGFFYRPLDRANQYGVTHIILEFCFANNIKYCRHQITPTVYKTHTHWVSYIYISLRFFAIITCNMIRLTFEIWTQTSYCECCDARRSDEIGVMCFVCNLKCLTSFTAQFQCVPPIHPNTTDLCSAKRAKM